MWIGRCRPIRRIPFPPMADPAGSGDVARSDERKPFDGLASGGIIQAVCRYGLMERLVVGAERLGFELSQSQLESFRLYYEELVQWNERVNLTAIKDYDEVQTRHFLDSLTVALFLDDAPYPVLDVGTGAGFPGIPAKILFPNIRLSLLESTAKKAAFLSHLVDRLGLEGVEVVTGRAEQLAHDARYRETFDVVLSRGVARLDTLAELALPFCICGGCLVAQKKGKIDAEVDAASPVIDILGGRLREVRWVTLEELDEERALVVIDKCAGTPQVYPRRPGIPKKRPIRARR
jgi:16S rRNA (guanine527-N7)-methyltransferase